MVGPEYVVGLLLGYCSRSAQTVYILCSPIFLLTVLVGLVLDYSGHLVQTDYIFCGVYIDRVITAIVCVCVGYSIPVLHTVCDYLYHYKKDVYVT